MDKIIALMALLGSPILLGYWTEKNGRWYERYNRGIGVLVFINGILYLMGNAFQWSRERYVIAFGCGIAVCGFIDILLWSKREKERVKISWANTKAAVSFWVIFGIIVALQIQGYLFRGAMSESDITVEVVNTMIADSRFYGISPYTGLPTASETCRSIYTPMQIFYMIICKISGVQAAMLVHFLIPFWILITCVSIWYEFGWEFWKEPNSVKLFLCIIVLLNIFGSGQNWLNVHALLFKAWKDETVLFAIQVPLVLLQLFEICREKGNKRTAGAVLGMYFIGIYAIQPKGKLYFAILLLITWIILLNKDGKIWKALKR